MRQELGSIFKALDIDYKNGLTDSHTPNMTVYQKHFFNVAKEKLKIDAIYFLRDSDGEPKIPLIYFTALDKYDPKKIADLHRLAWNLGEAPLLFIVTPEHLLIYNNYEAPSKKGGRLDPEIGLIKTIQLVNDLETKRQLEQYSRIRLETGEYWRDENRFDVKNRVDITLMNNLRIMRKSLIANIRKRFSRDILADTKLISIVHALLGRSILIKYLEERKDSKENTVFPKGFFSTFKEGAKNYADILEDKGATYSLFQDLAEHFNGDMFPLLNQEIDIIDSRDLLELRDFILGRSNFENRQLALWPLYSFNVIPIQLISSIYELFFHLKVDDKNQKDGTYYTPYHLVEMLMDEVLPWEGTYSKLKILDPACGSGIFLVEAYRRQIGKWMYSNETSHVTSKELIGIMLDSIYGIDMNEEAVRIASFSLSLVMCDYLEPRSIWETLTFPRLLGYNLFYSDCFAKGKFEEYEYDIVIGNPPWESRLSNLAAKYLEETRNPIGDKQIAQAFTWRAGELCSESGVVCLLMPSKGFLFNRSDTNTTYRLTFFSRYNVSVLINLSIFRKNLFEHATGPATAVVYSPQCPDNELPIFYCTPKPTYTIEDKRRFLIEPTDIRRIPRDIIGNSLIWKIAMWGTPRDMEFVNKLETKFLSLSSFLHKNNMVSAEGFIRGTKEKRRNKRPEYLDWPLITTKEATPLYTSELDQPKVDFIDYYRCTEKYKEVFKAPHLLIKQSPKKARFISMFLDYDALFGNSFFGIHGDEKLLKYICIVLSSKMFVYYSLMTSRRWLVERDELNANEILSFSLPEPTDDDINVACTLFKSLLGSEEMDYKAIDEFSYRVYELQDYEVEFVENAVDYVYDYFYAKGKSQALNRPTKRFIERYSNILLEILGNSLEKNDEWSCEYYLGDAPLIVIHLSFRKNIDINVCVEDNKKLNELLDKLDDLLISERSGSVAIKRNVRVYDSDGLYIIKPNQKRYWSYTAACQDADEIYAEIMRAWSKEYE